METAIVTALISGTFALLVAVVPVLLKHRLEKPRVASETAPAEPAAPGHSVPAASSRAVQAASLPSSLRRRIAILVGAFACGVLMELLKHGQLISLGNRGFGVGFLFFLALFAICLWLVFVHRAPGGDASMYQVEIAVLWIAGFSGYTLVHGGFWSDAIFGFGASWAGSAIVGGLLLAILRKR